MPVSNLELVQTAIAAAGRLRGVSARAVTKLRSSPETDERLVTAQVSATRLAPKDALARLAALPSIVGLESPPDRVAAQFAVRSPAVVAHARPPSVATREAALTAWPELYRSSSSWADYVFKKRKLFDDRPIVLAGPAGDDLSYLQHAATLEGAPFVCLAECDVAAFAAAAGCADVLTDADPDAQSAGAAAGMIAEGLNVHGTFAQLVVAGATPRRVLAVAGGGATPDLVQSIVGLGDELRERDEADVDVDALLEAHGTMLQAVGLFVCELVGETFDLAPGGTTLGVPIAPAGEADRDG